MAETVFTPRNGKPVGLILASGLARRMGADKVSLPWQGRTMAEHVRHCAETAGLEPVMVVRADWVGSGDGAFYVVNPCPEAGLGAALRLGLDWVVRERPESPVAILLADQPFVTPEDIRRAVTAYEQRPKGTAGVRPIYEGRPGHPVLLSPELVVLGRDVLSGDQGLGPWLAGRRDIWSLPVECSGRPSPAFDVDTPDEYQEALRQIGGEGVSGARPGD